VFEEMKRLKQERENLESIASTDDGAVGQVKRTASAGQQRARRSSMCSSLDFVGQDSLEAAKKRMTEMHAIKQRMAAEAAPLEPVKQTNFSQGLLTVSAPSNQGARRRHSVYEKPAVAARPTHPQPRRASVTYVQPPRVHVVKKAEPAAPKPAPARAPAPQPAAPPPPEPEKDPEPEPEIVPAAEPEKEEVKEEVPAQEEEKLEICIQRVDLDQLITFLAKQISRRFPNTTVPPASFLQETSNRKHIDRWRKGDHGMHVLKLVAQSDLSDSSKPAVLYVIDKKSDDGLAALSGDG